MQKLKAQKYYMHNTPCVSRVSAHEHLNITCDFVPHGRLPVLQWPLEMRYMGAYLGVGA